MIKRFLLLASLGCAALTFEASAEPVEFGNRDFYGFFLSNAGFTNASGNQYGFARQKFSATDSNELIYAIGNNVGLYAATAIDGVYYAVPYQFNSSLTAPIAIPMFTYNIYTQTYQELGHWNEEQTDFKPQDLTYDVANDRLLAVGYDPQNQSCIYEVNRETGAFTRLVHLPTTAGTIASDAFGRVFVMTNNGALYQVDMSTDNRMELLTELPYQGMMSNQTMEFDRTCNKLYWAANCLSNPNGDNAESSWLVEISLPIIGPEQNYTKKSGTYSYNQVGELGYSARFLGMYIPYCPGGFSAPGFATDIKAVSSEDGTECTLTFTTPTKCFNGQDDTAVDGYDLYREGVRIHTEKGLKAGQTVSYTDRTIPKSGTYRYDIVCYSNTGGDGPKTPVYTYIGYDRPAAVEVFNLDTSDDFRTVELSWEAPAKGALGGTFYPEKTRFDVTRLPDNVVVAQDIAETHISDTNIRRLLNYSYRVTAKNEYGQSESVSPNVIAGPPVSDLPLEETFENPTAFANRWSSIDNNNDTFTWLYGTDLGHSVFGDYEMTAEYIVSPTLDTSSIKDADDWIVSPPIAFEPGEKYCVVYEIRSLTPERFNVYVGDKPVVEGMNKIGTFALKEPVYSNDNAGLMLLQKYVVELPESVAGTIACVGTQLATPLNENFYSYVQLGSITIGNASVGVGNVESDREDVKVVTTRSEIIITGEFSNAALFSINGAKVMDVRSSSIAMDSIESGIYILNVDGRSFKIMCR